jgi:hypothetical protein
MTTWQDREARGGRQDGWADTEILGALWRMRALGQSAAQVAMTLCATRSAVLGMVRRAECATPDPDGLADDVLLSILDDFHGRGVSAVEIGRRLRLPRLAVLGLVHVLQLDFARSNGGERAQHKGNRDGDLPLGWWASGIWARGAIGGDAA